MAPAEVKVSGSLYLPWLRVESLKANGGKTQFTAMIRVKAPSISEHDSNASPVHLVVVLDVSGPRFDLLKMMKFIKEFLGDHQVDVVTALSDTVTEPMPIADWISQGKYKNLMRKRGGTTDLKLVLKDLNSTLQAVKKRGKSSVHRVGFFILVSDGESKFDCDDRCFENELRGCPPVHALGLGKKHDPKVLYRIAKESRGTYSSVPVADTDENFINNSKLVMEAMALCLGGLKSVVAIDTRVDISVPDHTETPIKDLKIVKIQSEGHKSRIDSSWRKGDITVGVLYADEVKDFIVRLEFRSKSTDAGRTRSSVLTAAVKYYKDISSEQEHLTQKGKQRRQPQHAVVVNCDVQLLVTSSHNAGAREAYQDLEKKAPNSRVMRQMILFEVAEMLLRFADTSSSSNVNGENLRDRWEKLNSPGPGEATQESLADLYTYLKIARENDLVDLHGIGMDIEAMVSCLKGGWGLGCIYSWVSSYQMQRATTMGLPPAAPPRAPFLTEAMEKAARYVISEYFVVEAPQASRRQRAETLLDRLENLYDKWVAREGSFSVSLDLGPEVHKAVKKAMEGEGDSSGSRRTTTTTSGSDDMERPAATNLRDHLEDAIKTTIATQLLDRFIEIKKDDDWGREINKAVIVGIEYWRLVKKIPRPEAAASTGRAAPPADPPEAPPAARRPRPTSS